MFLTSPYIDQAISLIERGYRALEQLPTSTNAAGVSGIPVL